MIYEYKGFHGSTSKCGVDLYKFTLDGPGRHVLIVTELADNPGTSVTNMAEQLATHICQDLDIPPQGLVVIEHCPEGLFPESYDIVTFDFDWSLATFTTPVWRRLPPERMGALIAECEKVELPEYRKSLL